MQFERKFGDFIIIDSKGRKRSFVIKWMDFFSLTFFYLDNKRVGVDDKYGWVYIPEGRPIRDITLKNNMDKISFGRIIEPGEIED